MNRIITFRMWDLNTKRFYYLYLNELIGFTRTTSIPKEAVIQQGTGLTNSKGHEIYEGDIVKWMDLNYLVEWNDFGYKWQARCPNYHKYHHPIVENFRDLSNAVIVGNIFETPELLKATRINKKNNSK